MSLVLTCLRLRDEACDLSYQPARALRDESRGALATLPEFNFSSLHSFFLSALTLAFEVKRGGSVGPNVHILQKLFESLPLGRHVAPAEL